MRSPIVARNYAETLLELAERQGGLEVAERYLGAMGEVAALLEREPRVRGFLESPSIDPEAKKRALRAAFEGRVPEMLLRFLLVVVDKRRQALLREIALAFRDLVDERTGRVRARVVLAREPGEATRARIRETLGARLRREVIPEFTVDPSLLGGVVVRVGDEVYDGSVRRRVAQMRRRLMNVELPHPAAV